GAMQRVPLGGTACAHRDASNVFLMLGRWASPAENETCLRWVREFWEAMRPFLDAGVYVNYMSEGEGEERVRGAYGANYDRLVKLKNKYDPTNFFRINQNIRSSKVAAYTMSARPLSYQRRQGTSRVPAP